ncbi:MAG TPA: glycosyltransferase [Nocardioidaceae bacterium]|nr:glycosyltransferase [Nocardioidaceae bacterium]
MDQTVRVLWLIKGLGAGGAERLLVSAARVGDHARFRYEAAYVVAWKDTLVPELAALGVPSHCLSAGGHRTPWPLALRRLLLTQSYDVVHLHSPLVAGVARLVVRTIPRSRRPVVVSTEHNAWPSYAWPTRVLNAVLHRGDHRRWAVSRRVRDSVWRPLRQGVEVLVHGIVLQDVVPPADPAALRASLGCSPDDVVAVTVANYREEKAYPDLLAAFAIAVRAEPRLRLLIIGQGVLEPEIRRLHAELGLAERCRIVGYREDVLQILSVGDFFVLASRFEGFPIALMEAMATGLPVVATRVGGIPDAVTDGWEGFLSDAGQPAQLAESIVRMATDDQQRKEMAARARERGDQFDIRAAVWAIERAYADSTLVGN